MKLLQLSLSSIAALIMPILVFGQPTSTPAVGFEWVKTSSGSYIDNKATIPESPSSTTFGEAGDTDPADCTTYCSGNCDGDALLEKLVFGGTSLPASSCEQRAINMVHWINANPDSDVPDGANTGTVHIATAAQIEMVSTGTMITGSDNKGFIIGGNGPGNFSEFNTQVDYSLNWYVDEYTLAGGTGNQVQQFTWNWGEPGGGTEIEMSGWNGYSTASFESTGGAVMNVPLGSLVEDGGNLEVVVEGNMEMSLSRNYGNADGKVQTVPSLEAEAIYTVNYDVWEIQAILPIELISFVGEYQEENIVLQWATASEVNSNRFEIERSTNQLNGWKNIGVIYTSEDSYRDQHYTLTDYNPASNNYYRLRQIDNDGKESLSEIISVKAYEEENAYSIFPNPANNTLNISSIEEDSNVKILDQFGKLILSQNAATTVDISQLPNGIYFVTITKKDGNIDHTHRFVKM